jgi:hypothetical protein
METQFSPQSSRRSFLKISLMAAAAFAAAGTAYYGLRPTTGPGKYTLDDPAKLVLGAIIPIFLQGAQISGVSLVSLSMTRIQGAISSLTLQSQQDVADLFKLLAAAPARRWLAGVDDDWQQAKPEQVKLFVQAWRGHRSPTLQTAYLALHDLVLGSWYADESTWAGIGYPGPIKELA